MGLLSTKKTDSAAAGAAFAVPRLAEISSEYLERAERFDALQGTLRELQTEELGLQDAISSSKAPAIKPAVAALLGDVVVDERAKMSTRLAEVRQGIRDHETALQVQRRRVTEARDAASVAVCAAVKPEYGRRVAALVGALQAAAAARDHLVNLTDELENDGVSWTRLGVFVPTFLGDRGDGHVSRFAAEAKGAGYVA